MSNEELTDEEMKNEILNFINDEKIKEKIEYYFKHKKYCYDCKNYYKSRFCGYDSSNCQILGSLDMNQKIYHPDKTAQYCSYFESNGKTSSIKFAYYHLIKYPKLIEIVNGKSITFKEYEMMRIYDFCSTFILNKSDENPVKSENFKEKYKEFIRNKVNLHE